MSSLASPLMIPGAQNPTGTQVSMPAPFSGSTGTSSGSGTGTNTLLPGGTPSTANPYASGFSAYGFSPQSSGASGSGTVPQPSTTIPGVNVGNTSSLTGNQTKELTSALDKTFGKGVGNLIQNFLSSGAGYSPQVLQQLFAQLQPQFANQQQNLLQQFSASGNRFGSGAETGYADLLGQQSMTEGSIAAQLYEQSVNNYIDVLMGAAGGTSKREEIEQQTPSFGDQLMSSLGGAAQGAGTAISGLAIAGDI